MEFGKPITMDPYKEQFFSGAEGAPRAAVKRLTGTIERELVEATINAPDWETLYAARMARDLLWEKVQSINLDEFVIISQTLVDLFATPDATPNVASVRRRLLDYYSLLQTTHLTNSVLSSLPLPRNLDPNTPASIPSRLYTLLVLIRDSLSAAVYLPFFFFPLVVHTPAYIMGRLGARLVEHEEETQAQNKVAFGLISLMGTYSVAFFFLWALFGYTIIRAILAGFLVYLFANYHNRMIDDTYERLKRFIAAWRLLVGVWAPRRWDLPFESLSWYTTPQLPPENPWIKRPKTPRRNTPSTPASNSSPHISPSPSTSTLGSISGDLLATQPPEPPVKGRRRPPSRKLMRHVLRARVEAIKALAGFFDQLERAGGNKRIQASIHLARRFKGTVETVRVPAAEYELPTGAERSTGNSNSARDQSQGTGHEEIQFVDEEQGWRDAWEVIDFLRQRGAKIPSLGAGESEWAALTSEAELGTPGSESEGPF
ncbi:hypothetical protein AX16_008263 [Volvariella volvacea WC 439]|nr:hypothetical protein AX16_008263 [Volvariella volvacea WC 439]